MIPLILSRHLLRKPLIFSSCSILTKHIHRSGCLTQQIQFKTPLSATEASNYAEQLRQIAGDKNVSISESVLTQHGQDEGPHKGIAPDLVAFAESTEHVSEVSSNCSVRLYICNNGK